MFVTPEDGEVWEPPVSPPSPENQHHPLLLDPSSIAAENGSKNPSAVKLSNDGMIGKDDDENHHHHHHRIGNDKSRWVIVILFCCLTAGSGFQWTQYPALMKILREHFEFVASKYSFLIIILFFFPPFRRRRHQWNVAV